MDSKEKYHAPVTVRALPDWEDLVGSGALMVRYWSQGTGKIRLLEGQECHLQISACVLNDISDDAPRMVTGTIDKTKGYWFHTNEQIQVCVGERDTVAGLDMALRFLSLGAKVEVKLSPRFGYEDEGWPEKKVPAGAVLFYSVHVSAVGAAPVPVAQMRADKRLEKATKWKIKGNDAFHRARLELATQRYGRALAQLHDFPVPKTEEMLAELKQLQVDIGNNLSTAMFMLNDHKKSKEACIAVLEVDNFNRKALKRACLLAIHAHEMEEAESVLSYLKEQEPDDSKLVHQLSVRIRSAKAVYAKVQRKQFGGFLNKKRRPSLEVEVKRTDSDAEMKNASEFSSGGESPKTPLVLGRTLESRGRQILPSPVQPTRQLGVNVSNSPSQIRPGSPRIELSDLSLDSAEQPIWKEILMGMGREVFAGALAVVIAICVVQFMRSDITHAPREYLLGFPWLLEIIVFIVAIVGLVCAKRRWG